MSEHLQRFEDGSERPELVFGLVGAAGTALNKVAEELANELRTVGYSSKVLVLSELISDLPRFAYLKQLIGKEEDVRIRESMKAGNDLRRLLNNGDAVARLAISAIRAFREKANKDPAQPVGNQAYIIKSLKHRGEYQSLANVYGDRFIVISAYEPRQQRTENLARRIAKSHNKVYGDEFSEIAGDLIDIDEKEDDSDLGQQVRDVFPLADVFVSFDDSLSAQMHRFVQILFQAPYRTPTRDEYGMFHARAAALRSADLSRQVGTVIATEEGEIVAAGCNEVPKAGGGSVWEGEVGSDKDYRDFRLGYDSTAAMKLEIVTEILESLKSSGWLDPSVKEEEPRRLAERALYPEHEAILKNRRVSSILEYGRIVHAEMSAITDAARRGIRIKDAVLYCTTFPCHMCARHIVAAGLNRVVYIEPYPKSMAKDLYRKSMCVDGDPEADPDAVRFEAFVGVAPRRYLRWFEMPTRKDARGYAVSEDVNGGMPRLETRFALPSELEAGYEESLEREELLRNPEVTTGRDDDGTAGGGLARAQSTSCEERGGDLGRLEERRGEKRGESSGESGKPARQAGRGGSFH